MQSGTIRVYIPGLQFLTSERVTKKGTAQGAHAAKQMIKFTKKTKENSVKMSGL